MKKGKAGGLSMMPKTGMEVSHDYAVFNYGTPIPQKYLKSQVRKIVAQSFLRRRRHGHLVGPRLDPGRV